MNIKEFFNSNSETQVAFVSNHLISKINQQNDRISFFEFDVNSAFEVIVTAVGDEDTTARTIVKFKDAESLDKFYKLFKEKDDNGDFFD